MSTPLLRSGDSRRAGRGRGAAARAPDRAACSASMPPTRRGWRPRCRRSRATRSSTRAADASTFEIEGTPGAPAADDPRQRQRAAASPACDDILSGRYTSSTGLGLGIVGARRLMDVFEIDVEPHRHDDQHEEAAAGARAASGAGRAGPPGGDAGGGASGRPAGRGSASRTRSCCATLEALHKRQEELQRVNRELEDTNRGVVALYAELDERADHLRRVDEVKTRFLSNMTHEFRTPVNSILALTTLLAERLEVDRSQTGRGLLHPAIGAAAVGADRRPAGPGQGRSRQDRGVARPFSRCATCSARCAACCGPCSSTRRCRWCSTTPTACRPSAPTSARSRRSCATSSRTP